MKSQIKKLISIFACVCLLLTAIIIPASAAGETASYVKVTEAPADWSGDYLIVYEDENMIFDGSLTTLDAVNNYKTVTISDGVIAADDATNAAKFTIAKSGDSYTVKSASGYYIGHTSRPIKFHRAQAHSMPMLLLLTMMIPLISKLVVVHIFVLIQQAVRIVSVISNLLHTHPKSYCSLQT